ncbi:hypothetical protein E1281_36850 [Actinomadura sp. KC345]|uniref:hypothetical protein n=1 Tax=Actinomadura sp. KC345 TaxID=2530371 RepID=UPI001049CF21|nr:hypothetical protein [Actinomadura sp. KC345]TDC41916.1 hypothetical protein E1281_36850 [Actinomadura sp. KC345]
MTSVDIDPTGSNISITATNVGNVIGANDRTGAALVCTSLVAQGEIPSGGPGLSPTGIAKVTSVTFSGCTVLGNPAVATANVSAANPWMLDVTDVTSGGETPGQLRGVDIHISVPALGCESDANGAGTAVGILPGIHVDRSGPGAPSQLKLPPPPNQGDNIELENVNDDCPDDIAADGDSVSVAGNLEITPGLTVLAT